MIREIGFWPIVAEDFRTHRRELSRPGFQALFLHRLGVQARNLPRLLALPLDLIYYVGYRFCRAFYGIEVRRTANLGRRLEIAHQHGIVIHDFIRMGDDCTIRQGVTFGISNSWEPGCGPVVGDNVSFGVGAVIVGNVTIGDNVFVGPNCVVSADVPADRTLFVPPPRAIPRETGERAVS
ncbi:MAG: serine acetyltransferase [Pseudomonadota bacterium]